MEYRTEEESALRKFFRSSRGDALGWGLIFLWGAFVVLIEETVHIVSLSWWDGWAVFFLGFGTIAIIGGIIALRFDMYTKAGWNFVAGFIILGFGLGGLLKTEFVWVLVLGAIAVILLYAASNEKWRGDDSDWNWCWPTEKKNSEK